MAVNNYKDKGSVIKFGGGVLKMRAVDDAGTYTSGDTTDLGYINDCGLRFETETEDVPDETGQTVTSLEGNDTVKLEGIFMQSNKSVLDFLRDNTVGAYYQVYYKATPTAGLNGLTQELFIGIAKLKRMFDVKANTKRIPFEFTLLKNEAAISIASPDSVYGCVETDTVTITANKYYQIVEN